MTSGYGALGTLCVALALAPAPSLAQKPSDPSAAIAPVRQGPGIVMPRLRKEVKPSYTAESMRMKLQGLFRLEAVVLADGAVGSVEAVSCDLKSRLSDSTAEKDAKARDALLKSKFVPGTCTETFGLADAAIKAVKQWQFTPGTKDGVAVPVLVDVEMTFTLK